MSQREIDSDRGWPDCNCQAEKPDAGECWCAPEPDRVVTAQRDPLARGKESAA